MTTEADAETYSRKRYVSRCVGCRLLFDTMRRDTLTCSPACRVRAHRNGAMKHARGFAKGFGGTPAENGWAFGMGMLDEELGGGLLREVDERAKRIGNRRALLAVMPRAVCAFDRLLIRARRERNTLPTPH